MWSEHEFGVARYLKLLRLIFLRGVYIVCIVHNRLFPFVFIPFNFAVTVSLPSALKNREGN